MAYTVTHHQITCHGITLGFVKVNFWWHLQNDVIRSLFLLEIAHKDEKSL